MSLSRAYISVLLLCACLNQVRGRHCRVDDAISWEDPNNLYTCRDEQQCCIENARPSCCSQMSQHEVAMKQVKLWGGVMACILVFGGLMWYARWDGQWCDDSSKLHQCCCCSRDDHSRHQRHVNMTGAFNAQLDNKKPISQDSTDTHQPV